MSSESKPGCSFYCEGIFFGTVRALLLPLVVEIFDDIFRDLVLFRIMFPYHVAFTYEFWGRCILTLLDHCEGVFGVQHFSPEARLVKISF